MNKKELLALSQTLAQMGNMMARPGSAKDATTKALINSAQAGIQQEAIKEEKEKQEKKSKGGALGSVGGMLAGLVAAPFTAGMSLPMAMAATGGATMLGSAAGQAIGGGKIGVADTLQAGMSGAMQGATAQQSLAPTPTDAPGEEQFPPNLDPFGIPKGFPDPFGLPKGSPAGGGESALTGNLFNPIRSWLPDPFGLPKGSPAGGGDEYALTGNLPRLQPNQELVEAMQAFNASPEAPKGYLGRMGQYLKSTDFAPIQGVVDAMSQYQASQSTLPSLGASDVMGMTTEQVSDMNRTLQTDKLATKQYMQREKDKADALKLEKQRLNNRKEEIDLRAKYDELAADKKYARDIGKMGIEYGLKGQLAEEADTRKAQMPVRLGGKHLFDPLTGQMISAPADPYTLSPGAVRYGPDGQVIASNPRPVATGGESGGGGASNPWKWGAIGGGQYGWINNETREIQPGPAGQSDSSTAPPKPSVSRMTLWDGSEATGAWDPDANSFRLGPNPDEKRLSIAEFMKEYGVSDQPTEDEDRDAVIKRVHKFLQWGLDSGLVDPAGANTFMETRFGKGKTEDPWFGPPKFNPTPSLDVSNVPKQPMLPTIKGHPVTHYNPQTGIAIILVDGKPQEVDLTR